MKRTAFFLVLLIVLTLMLLGCTDSFEKKPPATYTVVFDPGVEEMETFSFHDVEHGSTVPYLPTPPEREGYDFIGWNTEPDGSGKEFTEDTAVTRNITVYAVWKIKTYTVCFDPDGGLPEDPYCIEGIEHGSTVPYMPTPPTREGYNFIRWNLDSGEEFTADTVVTRDITVYAVWEIKKYVVCFHPNGGFPPYVYCVYGIQHGSTVPSPPSSLTREGYVLVSWNTEPDGSGDDYAEDMVVTASIAFYAQWEREKCSIERFSATDLDPNVLDGYQEFFFLLYGYLDKGEKVEIRIEDSKDVRWMDFEVDHEGISIKETGDEVGDRLTNPTITLTAEELIPDGAAIKVWSKHADTSNGEGKHGDPVSDVTVEVIIVRLDCNSEDTTTFYVGPLHRLN